MITLKVMIFSAKLALKEQNPRDTAPLNILTLTILEYFNFQKKKILCCFTASKKTTVEFSP